MAFRSFLVFAGCQVCSFSSITCVSIDEVIRFIDGLGLESHRVAEDETPHIQILMLEKLNLQISERLLFLSLSRWARCSDPAVSVGKAVGSSKRLLNHLLCYRIHPFPYRPLLPVR